MDDEQQIRDLLRQWFEVTRAGDVDGVLALMTDDVVFLTPGHAPFGKVEFERASRNQAGQIDGESTIDELEIAGDWAWIRTRLAVTMTLPTGEVRQRAGNTLSILRKQADGRWLLARDANLLAG